MAFIVEDGTGLPDANSYIDVDYFKAYHKERGRTITMAAGEIMACLIRASDYIDKRFGPRFRGFKQSTSQSKEWPRLDAEDDSGYALTGIPLNLKKGTAEYGWRAHLVGVLAPDVPPGVPGQALDGSTTTSSTVVGPLESTRQKVGPIEEELKASSSTKSFNAASGDWFIPEYPEADMLLSQLLESRTSRRLARAD